ncbi:MAG: Alanine dehydrogenase [Syntrophorhabdaceae bacterium PtaU1.Bin034]|nr:MAG: Alanine dehydrogenase [Syntrophorhabdaceae bacterium PtaU1.Bin034]
MTNCPFFFIIKEYIIREIRKEGRRVIIGIPKEIKNEENRVAIVPGGVETLVSRGHKVIVQGGAGIGSGFDDQEYLRAGAEIAPDAQFVFGAADLILKVKEPLPAEYPMLREGQILFTYLHLAASESLTINLIERKVIGIAYETVETAGGFLPLLSPMSEIAGRMAPQEGAKYLEETFGGRGVLLGGVPGVPPASVAILGAGNVGTNAARIAAGMGASVTILDISPHKLRLADDMFRGQAVTMIADSYNTRTVLSYADLVIGAVLVPGAKAPRLITREMLKGMKTGSVLVDVAIDQGGCAETSRPTTHDDPIYIEEGIVHYTVANMPGAVPRTATRALTLNTLPYVLSLAENGWKEAVSRNSDLRKGINLVQGQVTYPAVAEAFDLPYVPVENFLNR